MIQLVNKIFIWLIVLFLANSIHAQKNISLVSKLAYAQSLNDIWGYVDENGVEYALIGTQNSFSVVDLENPLQPKEIYNQEGPFSIWRDIKVWKNFAFVTNESDSGLLIVNMDSVVANKQNTFVSKGFHKYFRGDTMPWSSAHNLYIDSLGFAYIFGANYKKGGVIILDLNNDPWNPKEVGVIDLFYVHDGMVNEKDRMLHLSCINNGFQAAMDITDIYNPQLINTFLTPGAMSHNCWSDDENNFIYTTDEIANGFITAYDIRNWNNIIELDKWRAPSEAETVPHNTFYHNGFLVTAYYSEGVRIHDVRFPNIITETGYYDTSPIYTQGFNGCWGVYPYLPSGLIIASDIQEGLYVLEPNYQRAAYLQGNVFNQNNNLILGAQITLFSPSGNQSATSNFFGQYKMGLTQFGNFTFEVTAPGYQTLVQNIEIIQDSLQIVDFVLYPTGYIGVNEEKQNETINVHPNPVLNLLFVEADNLQQIKYNLVNVEGKEMLMGEIANGNNSIDFTNLPRGLYFLHFQNEFGVQTKKIIKE